ncbi:MAG: RagB/SusD family nutrient uptake outer membrane protein [Maribacter litoralis]|uniref:RagB/SusD family nutrient uptake outer membrane protein n=1 Tax=Maribacter litoralis TaxID=2059726 RepID=UPI003298A5D5
MATEPMQRFGLEPDLNKVFLKDSPETIWQFKPGEYPKNTREATQLIIQAIPGQTYALTDDLIEVFEEGDLRKTNWIASISDTEGTVTLHYAHKYKANLNETESLEYSILLRSAELYLIRAEARAHLGKITGAQQDLNAIRNRAGLPNTTAHTTTDLLSAILQERRTEFFTEQGHRWFDLKRTGLANETLQDQKLNWQPRGVLLPVPESEIEMNPNLLPQNNGYQ